MNPVQTSAPGKAVLSGEYVVLDGAPALSVALDRRATVAISASASKSHEVCAPGLFDGIATFSSDDSGRLQWADSAASESLQLFEHVWNTLSPTSEIPVSICIDSRAFFDARTGRKLGLGSSAAVAAALVAALGQCDMTPEWRLKRAQAAHRQFQNGRGSGVDIATSIIGGVIEYRCTEKVALRELSWPDGLRCRFLWSGSSASTSSRVENYLRPKNEKMGQDSRRNLAERAAENIVNWSEGSVDDILGGFSDYTHELQKFSDRNNLDIFAAGHDRMMNLASKHRIMYKPCGAGGGDVGVALGTDAASLDLFCDAAKGLGFVLLDTRPDSSGVERRDGNE